jgi:DNA polymerase III epsilon subunit-like protein
LTAPLAFIDTETTGVHPGRRAWEIAIIRREPNGDQHGEVLQIQDVDLSNADPFGLKVGRFYERHGDYSDYPVPAHTRVVPEHSAAVLVERMTRGAHLVGAVPNFDAEVFADMLRRHQFVPAWHYHLIDVEALAVGWIHGSGRVPNIEHQLGVTLPWKSDDLSRACGVEPATDDERHTALGDARWAMRLYDAITGGSQ